MRFLFPIVPALVAGVACAAEPPAEFFEKRIRPVLAEHCYQCHSAAARANRKLKGGLFLDSRAGMRTGGDSGPALVPGKPAESLLLKALQHADDVKMPPKGKLPEAVIADFEAWIKMGAPDPRTGGSTRRQIGMSIEEGRSFWAYQRPAKVTPPSVQGAGWAVNEIDHFVLARLEAAGLGPAADADRATLCRRLHFDLIGLPPTPQAIDEFVRAGEPDAYEKLVDKLVASPAFGERWGRHWLDVTRYAESVTLRGLIFKEAWRYRDYVIDSFNQDVPFDRFIREQIAGDLLPADALADRERRIVATTFLAMGNNNLEEQDKKQLRMDVVDEQVDVIAKAFLAQTVTCARCHDHKFDPIPTKDYYALAGILRNVKTLEDANVSMWLEVPLPTDPVTEAALKRHEDQIADLQTRIKTEKARGGARGGALRVKDVAGIVVDDAQAKKVGAWQQSTATGTYIEAGYVHDQDSGKGEKTITFQPDLPASGKYEVRLAYSAGPSRAEAAPVTVFSADGEKTMTVNMRKTPAIEGRYVGLGTFRFEKTGQSFVILSNEGTQGHVTADAVVFLPLDQPDLTPRKAGDPPARHTAAADPDKLRRLEEELKKLQATGPKRPLAMSVVEEKVIEDARVHLRGSVHTLGELAPRGFLTVTSRSPAPTLPRSQSGRKELADWIASRHNPLTARVIVNRAWHWLLGAGLVRTTDNFGTTGELPSHPELLDHLAVRFVEDGWSMKALIRRIVLSRTYRQSATGESHAADAENRLLGRANRRRLEAECIRDAVLAVSGRLDQKSGGPTFPATLAADYGYKASDLRRSVYLPVFRNSLPELLEVFDGADASVVTGRRTVSTVAPQALFLMNNPFMIEQSRHAARRLLAEKLGDDQARITRAYRLTLGREPSPGERRLLSRFLLDRKGDPDEAWTGIFHTLMASIEFRYVE